MEGTLLTENQELANSAPPACDHQEWVIGCERCFFEMKGIAMGELKVIDQQQGHMDTINGATLFGMHLMNVLADMEIRAQDLLVKELDIHKREIMRTLIANLRNLSVYITRVCNNPVKLEQAIISAAEFTRTLKAQMDKQEEPTPEPSNILLTDFK